MRPARPVGGSYNADIVAQWSGIDGLIECVSEQVLARATGVAAVSAEARIYLVFGHPLHAVAAGTVGVPAVEAIADALLAKRDLPITWTTGVTAGKAHSLTPADRVLDRLRVRAGSREPSAGALRGSDEAPMEDLGLRRLMSQRGDDRPASGDPVWGLVKASIAALLEASLHRHSVGLVELIGRADPDPRAILLAIDRARSMPIRMVSPARARALLDEAEALVREKMTDF